MNGFWRKWWGLIFGACTSSIMSSCWSWSTSRERSQLILLSYKPLHRQIYLVNIKRDLGLPEDRVESPIGGSVAVALHVLQDFSTKPDTPCFRRLTSTCSFDQLSMLKDLTFDICVPSFLCSAAHRMQRKMPNYITPSQRQHLIAFLKIPRCHRVIHRPRRILNVY